jgi:uncharacterized damage-inducible protein DinB
VFHRLTLVRAGIVIVCCLASRAQQPASPPSDPISLLASEWARAKLGTQEYIDAMPEDAIGFKPTPEIRSFAEQMLHIAGSLYMFSSSLSGKENPYDPKTRNIEKIEEFRKSKAALRKAVLESYDYMIQTVKSLEPARLHEPAELFRMKMPRHLMLAKALEHHAHHRGHTTIYLRLKGITPPSERLF